MWTPRRIGVLLITFVALAGTYAVYARALGWLDGLPLLPSAKLPKKDGKSVPPPQRSNDVSPTELRIIEAFGPSAAELSSAYPTKLEFRNGDSSIVLAAGPFPLEPGAKTIELVPFSLAVFGKAKPEHLRKPGEAIEINTFHADKAILEFDRPITTAQDLSKSKLVRLQMLSEPEEALPDPRKGKVHITNNQQSSDPNQMLVIRTPGPVFYRDSKTLAITDSGPDVWTDAAVEVVDRNNLPRIFGHPSPLTASEPRGSDFRESAVVAEILAARRLPPPTLTGLGLRLFFEQEKTGEQAAAKKDSKPNLGGVRRVELGEKVLINLWVDADTSIASQPGDTKSSSPLSSPSPPIAVSAVIGGLFDGRQAAKLNDKALLQIETLGPFVYDAATNIARFDVIAQANPDVPNDVQVSRVLARGGQQNLFSQVLEIEFANPPSGPSATIVPTSTFTGPPRPPAASANAGPTFKRLHAWTSTPGRFVTLTMSSTDAAAQPRPTPGGLAPSVNEQDQLVAFGNDLVYDQPSDCSTLQGAPLYVLRDRNVLTAGDAKQKRIGTLVLQPGPDKKPTTTVHGPGRIELYDAAAKANTLHATWQTSLTHTKEANKNREVDLLIFTDDASFVDTQADYRLKGNVLKLWLEGAQPPGATKPASGSQPLPQRLQALGDVVAISRDLEIENADQLNVIFQDAPPAAAQPPAVLTVPGVPGNPLAPMSPASPAPGTLPEKPKPPLKMTARLIDAFVVRTPQVPGTPAARGNPPKPGEGGALRYEFKNVRCEDRVIVHQDPAEADKPRGLDIIAQTLDVKQSRQGNEMMVTGPEDKPGEVHYEGMSILGPKVFIDQIHNRARVEGRGVLQMPSSSDLSGNQLSTAEDVKIFWRDSMDFTGATKNAEFRGKVSAMQGESWVTCHLMLVGFDRPIYFNQEQRSAQSVRPGPKETAKIESIRCQPAPADGADDPRRAGRVWFNEVRRDPLTKTIVKSQLVEAEDLTLDSQTKLKEPQNKVKASGHGLVRLWQPGQKDYAPASSTNAATSTPAKTEQEMKLTIVKYAGRMVVEDKKVTQTATFHDQIEVVHLATDDPNIPVELHRLPFGAMILKCTDTLTATTYRPVVGQPTQSMVAQGNAYIRTDEYEGWGEEIEYDGRLIILKGGKNAPARITSRFKNTENSGREIKLDRLTNRYELVDGVSGQIATPTPKK